MGLSGKLEGPHIDKRRWLWSQAHLMPAEKPFQLEVIYLFFLISKKIDINRKTQKFTISQAQSSTNLKTPRRVGDSQNASGMDISYSGANSKFQNRTADSRDKPNQKSSKKQYEDDLSNPYTFSSKFFAKKKRPQSTYESHNRIDIRNSQRDFVSKLNVKQEFMFKCLR
jgi:hypothetical protein